MAELLTKTKAFYGFVDDHHSILRSGSMWQVSAIRSVLPTRNGCRWAISSASSSSDLTLVVDQNGGWRARKRQKPKSSSPKMSLTIGQAHKWWEKGLQPNMKEIKSAQDLVDSLLGAGDKLVVVDFFYPGCGGCKALHPKICQLAEMNLDVQFLQVNYDEQKSMCYSLNVHVLPFFRFYRGAAGRVCSFSCTNATIKKFKDALAKHNTDRCSLGSPKGLEEKELLALSANKDLGFSFTLKSKPEEAKPVPMPQESVPGPIVTPTTVEAASSSSILLPLPFAVTNSS